MYLFTVLKTGKQATFYYYFYFYGLTTAVMSACGLVDAFIYFVIMGRV